MEPMIISPPNSNDIIPPDDPLEDILDELLNQLDRLLGPIENDPNALAAAAPEILALSKVIEAVSASVAAIEEGGVLVNRAAGTSAEALAMADLEAQGYNILGSQVTARTSAGIRYIDHLVQTPDGEIFAVEVKSGGAIRNSSQLLKDELMYNEGAQLGNNAPELLKGQTLQIDTVEMHY